MIDFSDPIMIQVVRVRGRSCRRIRGGHMQSPRPRLDKQLVRRRQVLAGGMAATVGLAGLAAIGCGDDSTSSTPTKAASTSGGTAAPSSSAAASQPKRGGTVTFRSASITHVDPHRSVPTPGLIVTSTSYSGLLRNEIHNGTTLVQHLTWPLPGRTQTRQLTSSILASGEVVGRRSDEWQRPRSERGRPQLSADD